MYECNHYLIKLLLLQIGLDFHLNLFKCLCNSKTCGKTTNKRHTRLAFCQIWKWQETLVPTLTGKSKIWTSLQFLVFSSCKEVLNFINNYIISYGLWWQQQLQIYAEHTMYVNVCWMVLLTSSIKTCRKVLFKPHSTSKDPALDRCIP